MDLQPPSKQWWVIAIAFLLCIGSALMLIYIVTAPALEASRLGQPLPADWTWTSIIIWDLIFIALEGILFGIVLIQACTFYTNDGIRRLRLPGRIRVEWKDVSQVIKHHKLGVLAVIEIKTATTNLMINVFVYKDPDRLVSYIQQQVPASASWHQV